MSRSGMTKWSTTIFELIGLKDHPMEYNRHHLHNFKARSLLLFVHDPRNNMNITLMLPQLDMHCISSFPHVPYS